ncbi:hypothetical protein RHMOL_Rhmol02G0226700 [Rhododendron molle]|uniref:Uncharacterized protein n=1 Tax=Rhododendron molle TaxID=49168 RepID=A0ACC0PTH3_RHOML|nr:hypothetical protein RHMOL_Rhmol02G0226700 [Rhododendron molle]
MRERPLKKKRVTVMNSTQKEHPFPLKKFFLFDKAYCPFYEFNFPTLPLAFSPPSSFTHRPESRPSLSFLSLSLSSIFIVFGAEARIDTYGHKKLLPQSVKHRANILTKLRPTSHTTKLRRPILGNFSNKTMTLCNLTLQRHKPSTNEGADISLEFGNSFEFKAKQTTPYDLYTSNHNTNSIPTRVLHRAYNSKRTCMCLEKLYE